MVENRPANAGDVRDAGWIPGLGRFLGEGNGNPFQYSFLENSMDRGAWQAIVHRVPKSWTQLKRQITSRRLMFIQLSQLTRCPLYVSPFLSSTNWRETGPTSGTGPKEGANLPRGAGRHHRALLRHGLGSSWDPAGTAPGTQAPRGPSCRRCALLSQYTLLGIVHFL